MAQESTWARWLVRVGQPVMTETIIGSVGHTGNAMRTPPHLHLAIATVTGATNPLPLLRDRLDSSPEACLGVRSCSSMCSTTHRRDHHAWPTIEADGY